MHDQEITSALKCKAQLLGSLLLFTRVFFKIRTGREFVLSRPIGRESHYVTISRALTKIFRGESRRLAINIPPGHGKSEMVKHFIAWALAHYPDSAFLYISYSHDLASKHTYGIKQIIQLPEYRELFGVEIKRDSSAKDMFSTTSGGVIAAFGSAGAITGQDGGLPNLNRFSGGVFIDDFHKPDEVHSAVTRGNVLRNYKETIKPRPRGPNIPIVVIGQRLHEDDIFANLFNGFDGDNWESLILQTVDNAENLLAPNLFTQQQVEAERTFNEYVFYSQHQQTPQPAGGGIFKTNYWIHLDDEPQMLATFATIDTAETDKTYNDATVFSFWGIYKIEERAMINEQIGLHWIDCLEIRVTPDRLEQAFLEAYGKWSRHPVSPLLVAIEKKSTGVTMSAILQKVRGLSVYEIERKGRIDKTARFLAALPYAAKKLVSFSANSQCAEIAIPHMSKITANQTHLHDDICDTFSDAVDLTYISKIIPNMVISQPKTDSILEKLANQFTRETQARAKLYARKSTG